MFKRSGALSLAILYTITVLGFALNLHYCGSTVASVKITAPAKEVKTDTCGMKMNCCKNHKVEVQVKDEHQGQQEVSFLAKLFAFEIPKLPFEDFIFSAQKALFEKFFDRGPPEQQPSSKVATFLKNCTFRI